MSFSRVKFVADSHGVMDPTTSEGIAATGLYELTAQSMRYRPDSSKLGATTVGRGSAERELSRKSDDCLAMMTVLREIRVVDSAQVHQQVIADTI
jgi:hypothetical protein